MPPTPESSSTSSPDDHSCGAHAAAGESRPIRIFRHFLRLLLPPVCQLCGKALPLHSCAPELCPACISGCIHQPPAACPICAEPYVAAVAVPHPCARCAQHPPAFVWLKTMGIHAEDLQHGVHQLKYAGRFHLGRPLAHILLQRLTPAIAEFAPHAVIPVPLHPDRLRERGFNQSLLVARHIGATLKIPVNSNYLVRVRATQSQTNLTRQQRRQNLKGAFTLQGSLIHRRILLVDDVVTTTSTCRECATTLANAGHTVAVVALGRARLHS